MPDCVEVSIELELVRIVLRLAFGVQVILASKICEGACLSQGDVRFVDSEDEWRCWWLLGVDAVISKFIGTELCVC